MHQMQFHPDVAKWLLHFTPLFHAGRRLIRRSDTTQQAGTKVDREAGKKA